MIIYSYSTSFYLILKPFERFGSLSDPVGTSTSTSYTLPSHLTTIARSWVCCRRKREYDRKDRRIVDRKPEKNEKFLVNAFPLFNLQPNCLPDMPKDIMRMSLHGRASQLKLIDLRVPV